MLSPKTVAKIRKIYSGKIACWCQDQLTTMGRQYMIGAEYDKVFVKDHYLEHVFKNYLDMDVHYLPEACNPVYHKTVELNKEEKKIFECDIFTFGNLYYYRQSLMQPLKEFDLRVWGHRPSWLIDRLDSSFMGRGVYEDEKCKAVAGAKITLNSLHFGEIQGLNARTFEVAGCGGFQLSSYSSAVHEHFKVGEEIETFCSRNELLEKTHYYLENPDKAKNIAEAGNKKAYAEHTYEHRLNTIFEIAGIDHGR
jgi:spore maturation protein CgeB